MKAESAGFECLICLSQGELSAPLGHAVCCKFYIHTFIDSQSDFVVSLKAYNW